MPSVFLPPNLHLQAAGVEPCFFGVRQTNAVAEDDPPSFPNHHRNPAVAYSVWGGK